jgi:hypothetical protein
MIQAPGESDSKSREKRVRVINKGERASSELRYGGESMLARVGPGDSRGSAVLLMRLDDVIGIDVLAVRRMTAIVNNLTFEPDADHGR